VREERTAPPHQTVPYVYICATSPRRTNHPHRHHRHPSGRATFKGGINKTHDKQRRSGKALSGKVKPSTHEMQIRKGVRLSGGLCGNLRCRCMVNAAKREAKAAAAAEL
jgi:hypothetical protein